MTLDDGSLSPPKRAKLLGILIFCLTASIIGLVFQLRARSQLPLWADTASRPSSTPQEITNWASSVEVSPSKPKLVVDDDDLIDLEDELTHGDQASPGVMTSIFQTDSRSLSTAATLLPGSGGAFGSSRAFGDKESGGLDSAPDGGGENGNKGSFDIRDALSPLASERFSDEGDLLDSDRLFGGRVRTAAVSSSEVNPAAAASDANQDAQATPLPWVSGQARGYAMLYAMSQRARPVVESNVKALLDARIREPYIGVLIDGTFGRDFAYLRNVIDRLSQDGRQLTLVLYLTNGPAMRRFATTGVNAPFTHIDPVIFRTAIRFDQGTRAQFSRIANDALRVFLFNREAHPMNKNVAVVMLEDNLDRDSYTRMRALAGGTISRVATTVRNPCIGCYDGNDGNSLGDSREEHSLQFFPSLRAGDGFSLDGVSFAYPGETGPGGTLSSDQTIELMRASYARKLSYVGLWRHQWQGVAAGEDSTSPDTRTYIPSTKSQREFEIQVLRESLPEEIPDNVPANPDSPAN